MAEIIAFDTMKARAAVRDVARVMNIPYALADKTAKLIGTKQTIAEASATPELKSLRENEPQVRRLLEMAERVEGMPRHITTHPAGVVIAEEPVLDLAPLLKNDEMTIIQYEKDELEELGMLKMDFLGLRNLTIIRDCVRSIQKKQPDFDISKIPLDDADVYRLISSGNTSGVFQLESNGIRQVLQRLKPRDMNDIIAVLALYRPGPMDSITKYIHNRSHPEDITYLHPMLEEILRGTYGCIIYQEQVMQICRKLAGYSYGRADLVRRAMSKKKASEMEKERHIFLYGTDEGSGCIGAVANGVPLEIAETIFDQMESFAHYAFNKSHAVAYGLIAYQTAYLKTHHFADYMAALMTSVISESAKLQTYLEECRIAGIRICTPDVNASDWAFSCKDGKMMFGLLAIRNLGKGLISKMMYERSAGGEFRGFVDFCRRMSGHGMNKRALEALIQAGALDHLDCNRRQMLLQYEQVMDAVGSGDQIMEGQMSLFGDAEMTAASDLIIHPAEDFSLRQRLQMEKDAAGMYLSGHPLDEVRYLQDLLHTNIIGGLQPHDVQDQQMVKSFCIVRSIKKYRTKKGDEMCFVTAEDTDGTIELVVFPKLYQIASRHLVPEAVLYVTGKISHKEDEISILAESIRAQQEIPLMLRQMQLCVKLSHAELGMLSSVENLCRRHGGDTEVIVYLTDEKRYVIPRRGISVEISESLYQELCSILPRDRMGCIPAFRRKQA